MTTAIETNKGLYLPGRRLLTRQEFEQIADSGAFGPEERLELIEGEILTKELLMKTPHATAVSLAEIALRQAFPTGYVVCGQLPLALGERNELLPDIAVVVGSIRDYEENHPITAVLVVEIADTTLRFDRTTKVGLYARAGILEYWIVNLNERLLEVHREPEPRRGRPLGYYYADVVAYTETDSLAPLAAAETVLAVSEFLPRRRST